MQNFSTICIFRQNPLKFNAGLCDVFNDTN